MGALNLQDLKMSEHKKNNDWKLQHLENEGPNRMGWKMQDLENSGLHIAEFGDCRQKRRLSPVHTGDYSRQCWRL